ncbi:MAG: aspartate/glutamate racemase family protein [Rhodospirillales bacterium]
MKLLLINPNTTESMTAKAAAAARAAAQPGTEIIEATSQNGPASIQGYLDGAACLPGLLAEAARRKDENPDAVPDAVIVACFDDTGVDALRCMFDAPVIGIGEAAYHAAAMLSVKFSVVTTLARSVPVLEDNLARYGLAQKCARVRASGVPVLKLEEGDPESLGRIRAEIRAAVEQDGADAVVLGCAGMADLMNQLSREFNMPVIDGVVAAVKLAEGLAGAGFKTSKAGAYAAS